MIGSKNILDRVQELVSNATNLTDLKLSQLTAIEEFISRNTGLTVATLSNLPDAVANEGRLVYVTSEEDFYFSTGVNWVTFFDSSVGTYPSILYAWGCNSAGKLGDDTEVARSSPITVVGGITNWSQVSLGKRDHCLGITNGVAYAWGNNNNGQLGDDSIITKSSPITVVGGITNWSQVSAGDLHSLGLTGGVAYAWGRNNRGQLGDNSGASRSSPVTVVGGITNWSQVSAGDYFSLGLTETGIAYGWGSNTKGQIGDDTIIDKSSPVTVIGGITNWSQLSAGFAHFVGIANGVAYTCGENVRGQLGDNDSTSKSSPVTVVGGITNWSQVSAGGRHCLGIAGGVAYGWGDNGQGRIGDNSLTSRSSPVTVVGGITNWSQVSAGGRTAVGHSIGLTDTGIIYTWGHNSTGVLGSNNSISRRSPATIVGDITNWSQVNAGGYSNIGIRSIEKGFNEP